MVQIPTIFSLIAECEIHRALTVGSGFQTWMKCWVLFIVQLLRRWANQNICQPADCDSIAWSSKLTPTRNISKSGRLQSMLTLLVTGL